MTTQEACRKPGASWRATASLPRGTFDVVARPQQSPRHPTEQVRPALGQAGLCGS